MVSKKKREIKKVETLVLKKKKGNWAQKQHVKTTRTPTHRYRLQSQQGGNAMQCRFRTAHVGPPSPVGCGQNLI